jgi:hypothetical protein
VGLEKKFQDFKLKDDAQDLPSFEPLLFATSMEDRPDMIGQLNFSDPPSLATFHVTAKSGLSGYESETTFEIPDVPIYKWQIKRPPTPQPQNKCRCVLVLSTNSI